MQNLVSIIIPCYNDVLYIEQSVNSALNQTYKNIEVIVVDDGSNKATKDVLKKMEPHVTKLITQENKGQSTARNVGIKAAKGEHILVLDSDDFFDPTFCEKAIKIFKVNKEVKVVTCYSNRILDNKVIDVFKPRGGTINDFLYNNGAMGSSMFKKEDWNRIGGYDEMMRNGFEDWEYYIRKLKEGGVAKVIDEPLFNYRLRKDSTTSIANKIKNDLFAYIILKHNELYKSNFESTIIHLLELAKKNKNDELKRLNSIDFKIGAAVLKPLRYLKKILK